MTKSDEWDREEKSQTDLGLGRNHDHGGGPPRRPPNRAPPPYRSNPFYRAQNYAMRVILRMNFFTLLVCALAWALLEVNQLPAPYASITLTFALGGFIGWITTRIAMFMLDRKWEKYKGGALPT